MNKQLLSLLLLLLFIYIFFHFVFIINYYFIFYHSCFPLWIIVKWISVLKCSQCVSYLVL